MKLTFTEPGWQDYLYWQTQDKRTIRRINQLIQDIERGGNAGLGKTEALKGNYAGLFSRRIDEANRLIYQIDGNAIVVFQCRGHYED
ncbi:MAG: Txe/YoeB family addiction module toxin [Oscillospiraceae bacterium]|nr:Txe/YoeB family addiction module toxin [Oscillospiraceae bacterium]